MGDVVTGTVGSDSVGSGAVVAGTVGSEAVVSGVVVTGTDVVGTVAPPAVSSEDEGVVDVAPVWGLSSTSASVLGLQAAKARSNAIIKNKEIYLFILNTLPYVDIYPDFTPIPNKLQAFPSCYPCVSMQDWIFSAI